MTQEEKNEVKQLIIRTMMDYRGLMKDRVRAVNYLNIDEVGEVVADIVIDKLEREYDLKPKKSTPVRWSD